MCQFRLGKSETDNTTIIDCHGKNGKLIQIINVSKNSCTGITEENSGKCEYNNFCSSKSNKRQLFHIYTSENSRICKLCSVTCSDYKPPHTDSWKLPIAVRQSDWILDCLWIFDVKYCIQENYIFECNMLQKVSKQTVSGQAVWVLQLM